MQARLAERDRESTSDVVAKLLRARVLRRARQDFSTTVLSTVPQRAFRLVFSPVRVIARALASLPAAHDTTSFRPP